MASSTASQLVTTGVGAVAVSANLSGLSPGTTYYYRVQAQDTATGAGVAGSIKSFKTTVPLKQINSTMRWNFLAYTKYVKVAALSVVNAPVGASVTVVCSGKGCPFGSHSQTARAPKPSCSGKGKKRKCEKPKTLANVNLVDLFKHRKLGYGAKVTVRLTERGYVGKEYVFNMSRSISPTIGCLAPGSTTPGQNC